MLRRGLVVGALPLKPSTTSSLLDERLDDALPGATCCADLRDIERKTQYDTAPPMTIPACRSCYCTPLMGETPIGESIFFKFS